MYKPSNPFDFDGQDFHALHKDSTPSPQPTTLHVLKKVRQIIRKVTRFRTVTLGTPCIICSLLIEGGCQDAGISD